MNSSVESSQAGMGSAPGTDWCPDAFLDDNVSWNTQDPDVSVCLQKTLLLWIPCGFFWLVLPIKAWQLFRRESKRISPSLLNILRTVIAAGVFCLAVADLLYWAQQINSALVDIADAVLRIVTWLVVVIIIQYERLRGRRSSGWLWMFFTVYLLANIPRLYSQIRRELLFSPLHRTELISTCVSFLLVFILWILGFCVDSKPTLHGSELVVEDSNECPEMDATFPSLLLFNWFNRLAWTGYKRALTEQDLWSLNPRDRSATVASAYDKHWHPKLKQAKLDKVLQTDVAGEAATAVTGLSASYASGTPDKVHIQQRRNRKSSSGGTAEAEATKSARESLSIFPPLVKAFGTEFLMGSVLKLFHDLLVFVSPLLLRRIILFSESPNEPVWRGVAYAGSLLFVALIQTSLLSQYFYRMYLIGIWSKSSLISAVYRKSLRLSSAAKKESTSGEIVNLMSVDCQRIADLVPYLNMLWSAPLQISVAIFLLYEILGPSVFAGLAVMIVLIPVNGVIAAVTRKLHMKMMKQKDVRVKKMNELLQGIKILKLYAWEPSFQQEVEQVRNGEMDIMLSMAYLSSGTAFIWSCAPFVVSLVSFATYVLSSPDNILDSQKAFTALALFNILRFPLSMLPMMITSTVQASVSVKRINKYMRGHELDPETIIRQQPSKDCSFGGTGDSGGKEKPVMAVRVEDASFKWEAGAGENSAGGSKKEVADAKPKNGIIKGGPDTATPDEKAVMLNNGTSGGGEDSNAFRLSDINVAVRAGSLVAVVGSVGAGKSSFISALLGEMDRTRGSVQLAVERMAYVSQQAWIQNATLRDNILFGAGSLDEGRYQKVISDCALQPDLDILPAGDQTEIGEKGINLSGGQKQRVAIARAVYADADLYLLDDPLSAVDSHVGRHIFDRVIGPHGSLAGRTRVLVTHGLTFLPQVDQIIVFKDGTISECGTYRDLLEQKGDFADFLLQYLSDADGADEMVGPDTDGGELDKIKQELAAQLGNDEFARQISLAKSSSEQRSVSRRGSSQSSVSNGNNTTADETERSNHKSPSSKAGSPTKPLATAPSVGKPQQQQYQEEKSETGRVSWRIYLIYFHNMGLVLFLSCVLLYAVYQFFSTFASIWLSYWADLELPFVSNATLEADFRASNTTTMRDIYLGVYGGIGFAQALGAILANLLLNLSTLSGSRALHAKMLARILHAPMSFFDTTPQGRIVNRFSKDVDVLDSTMPMIMRGWLTCLLQVLATFLVIMYTTPPAILFIFVVLVGYYFVQRVYVASSRQLKRLESVSKSPIYSHFGESLAGASVIRAYGAQDRFIKESQRRVDVNHRAAFTSVISNRWLAVRLETVGNLIIFASALFAVLARHSLTGGLVGLSVSFALQVTQTLNWLVRMTSEVETNIVAVERLDEYSKIDVEDDWQRDTTESASVGVNSDTWPSKGHIQLESYSTRYRPGLDLVLRNISLDIQGGERIGIVGRTGAGKSSLTLALFRIVEPAAGTIKIDGIDVTKLGLHSLRGRLTIIPQDPVLFSGSLRRNLDPFGRYTDAAVWQALRHAHLAEFVSGLGAGLEHEVAEGGDNLSVGQRQLVCLARALLRKTKVLVLDEATAAVDLETDDIIQETIRKEFQGCTIITIAHRLNTIMDYDRVLVLSEGHVAELDQPKTLMHKEGTIFRGMCQDAGLV